MCSWDDIPAYTRARLSSHVKNVPKASLARIVTCLSSGYTTDERMFERERIKQKKAINKELQNTAEMPTPYGTIMSHTTLQVDGEPYKWVHVNMFALIHAMCVLNTAFAAMLQQAVTSAHGMMRLGFFIDEMTPGNALRPDLGRKIQCLYFTVIDMPCWYRCREYGWWLFGTLPTKTTNKLACGLSSLVRATMHSIFSQSSFNLATTGFRFPTGDGQIHHVKGMVWTVEDERAIKFTLEVKGSGGLKPCFKCSNVLNLVEGLDGDPLLVSYRTAKLQDCLQHTDESFYGMVDELNAKKSTLSATQFNELQIALGLRYVPDGLSFDPWLRKFLQPVSTTLFCWMHVFLASAGVGQYHCNIFIHELRGLGVTLLMLDAWKNHIAWGRKPDGVLTKTFFQDRFNNNPEGSLKCFAAETAMCVAVLSWFAQEFDIQRHLPAECVCIHLLHLILSIYALGDYAGMFIEKLTKATDQYCELFALLHPDLAKKKIHYARHCPDQLKKARRNLSGYPGERKHKQIKARAAICYGRFMDNYIFKSHINEFLSNVKSNANIDRMCYLVRPQIVVCPFFGALKCSASFEMRSRVGTICKDDLVTFGVIGGKANTVGKVCLCFETDNRQTYICFSEYYEVADNTYADKNTICIAEAKDLQLRCAHIKHEDKTVKILWPLYS